MAGKPVNVANTLEAIQTGAVPGSFTPDRTTFVFPTMTYDNSLGKKMLWTISVQLRGPNGAAPIADEMLVPGAELAPGSTAVISVKAQQERGKVRPAKPTIVREGKNLGRKNATNALTQAIRDALGLYSRHQRHVGLGAAAAAARAAAKPRSPAAKAAAAKARGRAAAKSEGEFDAAPPPMLVKVHGSVKDATLTPADFAEGVTVQHKLNGVHLVAHATPDNAALVLYSRTSAVYPGQQQLEGEIIPMLKAAPPIAAGSFGVPADATPEVLEAYTPPTPHLDGELYLHGRPLRWISGQARKDADEGLLEYHVFDVFFPRAKAAGHDMPSRDRQAYIDALFAAADAAGVAHPHVIRVGNVAVHSLEEIHALAKDYVAAGYEGAIARKDAGGYRYSYGNYHSAALLKFKPKYDDEFPVVGFTQGTKGKDVGAVIWICEVPKPVDPRDRRFNVVPKDMTYPERYRLFQCLGTKRVAGGPTRFEEDIKGLPLTVEYAELSEKTGKPQQAKALAFRTYEGGPEKDPVRALLLECAAAKPGSKRGPKPSKPAA